MKRDSALSSWRKSLSLLSDESLLNETKSLACSERERTAWLVAHLAEVYRRNLALQRGYPSAFKYARVELGLTDAMTWERVTAAQLALEIPEVIERIASGELSLAAAGELWRALREEKKAGSLKTITSKLSLQPAFEMAAAPPAPRTERQVVSKSEKKELLKSVLGKSRKESEFVLREWKQDRSGTKEEVKPRPSSARRNFSKEWTELSFFLGPEELEKLDRLRDLLSHRLNSRDPHAVMSWLLELGLEKVDPIRQEARIVKRTEAREHTTEEGTSDPGVGSDCQTSETRSIWEGPAHETIVVATTEARDDAQASHSASNHAALFLDRHDASARKGKFSLRVPIPAKLKRRVWVLNPGGCQYQDSITGRICGTTAYLDCDHVVEVRNGGKNTESNLRPACRAHNRRRHLWDSLDTTH